MFMKKKKVISIIGNGEMPGPDLREIILHSKLIIAADGGANHCRTMNIKPDYIIGDLDSISSLTKQEFVDVKTIHLAEQQTSDLEKALAFAQKFYPNLLQFFAIFGNRSDHTIYNMKKFTELELKQEIRVFDNFGFWQILSAGQHSFNGKKGERISFFSPGKIRDLSIRGFQFPLKAGDYDEGVFSLSNAFWADTAILEFSSGKLLVYRSLIR